MGQKTSPISLRLKTTNKSFDSCWYSDLHYSTLLSLDLKARSYIDKIFEQIRYPTPLISLSLVPKRAKILMVYLNPERSRNERGERFQLKPFVPPRVLERQAHGQPSLLTGGIRGKTPENFHEPGRALLRNARARREGSLLGTSHLVGLGGQSKQKEFPAHG